MVPQGARGGVHVAARVGRPARARRRHRARRHAEEARHVAGRCNVIGDQLRENSNTLLLVERPKVVLLQLVSASLVSVKKLGMLKVSRYLSLSCIAWLIFVIHEYQNYPIPMYRKFQ